MPKDEYNQLFDAKIASSPKLKKAYEQVADIRKFEIELYWKRATYFWALIAVAFAGYFAILSSKSMPNKFFLSMAVASTGFVVSFAWYLANRGSKYWQENWEHHMDLLEDNVTGPLYKTILDRSELESLDQKLVTGPLSVSVSKIHQWVSVYIVIVWTGLIVFSCYKSFLQTKEAWDMLLVLVVVHASVPIIALICCILMVKKGRTYLEEQDPRVRYRETWISERIE